MSSWKEMNFGEPHTWNSRDVVREKVCNSPWIHEQKSLSPIESKALHENPRTAFKTIRDVIAFRVAQGIALPWECGVNWSAEDCHAGAGSFSVQNNLGVTEGKDCLFSSNYFTRPHVVDSLIEGGGGRERFANMRVVFLDLDGVLLNDAKITHERYGMQFKGMHTHEIVFTPRCLDLLFGPLVEHLPDAEIIRMVCTPRFLPTMFAWRLWVQSGPWQRILQWQAEDPSLHFVMASHHNSLYDTYAFRDFLLYPL
eukprot:PhF_6_TR33627/c0_g1_i1/m.49113